MVMLSDNSVVYDLSKSPITFDFAVFLANARLSLARAGKDPFFHLYVLADEWRNVTPREKQYDLNERLWRLHNLILPVSSVTPGITGVSVIMRAEDRARVYEQHHDFVSSDQNYLIKELYYTFASTGFNPHLFLAPDKAKEMASVLLRGHDKTAVLSIRASTFETSRDTPVDLFFELGSKLHDDGYSVFIIPDQEVPLIFSQSDFPYTLIHQAAVNIPLRLALNELASVSICTSSGPTSFLSLAIAKPNMVVCFPIRDGVRIASPEYFMAHHYDIGNPQPLPWIPENQIWVWDLNPSAEAIFKLANSIAS